MNRTALVLLVLAALVITGGIVLGRTVESMAAGIANQRAEALADPGHATRCEP